MAKTVLETILAWSDGRPVWQQDALRRIIASGPPDDDGISELLALCKKEHGEDSITENAIPLKSEHLPVDPGEGESISIAAVENVVGVNQLALSQTVSFEPKGLTVIYGPNGTGKSGYSRILKKACRARHAGNIMPDIYNPPPTGNATATISVVGASGTITPVNWEDDGEPPALLSAITVFDRDCASVHVQKKNEVWFRPFGLDIPDDLAGVCQRLKDKLTSEKASLESLRDPIFSNPTWSARSAIGKKMSALKINTDLKSHVPTTEFSEKDEARLIELTADLQQDGTVAAARQRQFATRFDQAATYLRQIAEICSDASLGATIALKTAAVSARNVADTAATQAFRGLELEGVGEPTLKDLWESARRYSETIGEGGLEFPPNESANCVLCHQTIDTASAARMLGFENFIKQDTETKAVEAERKLKHAVVQLTNASVHVDKVSQARQTLLEVNLPLARALLKFLAVARLRQRQTLTQIAGDDPVPMSPLPENPADKMVTLATSTRSYASSLVASPGGDDREKLLTELDVLKDLKQTEDLINIGETEIARLINAKRIDDCLKDMSTTAITRLGNTIADDLITPLMRDKFREEIGELAGNRVRVEVVRSGGKFGSPQYEVRLYANPKAKVHDVLSEGEQTCVALAAYLTELANATHTSALVFDDPVNSLDHKWRNKVAKRLAKEAKTRQIVVFTHDLIFVNDLHQLALEQKTPLKLAHLSRGEEGVGIVNSELPWRASGVRERIDMLEKALRSAKGLYDSEDDESYRGAAHGIYDKLRAAWERALEDIVFAGVLLGHRDYINTKGLRRVTALDKSDVDAFNIGFKKCCDYVEAHDASRGRDSDPPEPTEISSDIDALKTWSEALRAKMNTDK